MAGILPDFLGANSTGGLFGSTFGQPPQQQGLGDMLNNNQNSILGYLAGALQGGNLGQSIAHGLPGLAAGSADGHAAAESRRDPSRAHGGRCS
jgi:hypothetical protein